MPILSTLRFLLIGILLILSQPVSAVEFNTKILEMATGNEVDLSRFQTDDLPEGDYWVRFFLNSRPVTKDILVNFTRHNEHVEPCIPLSVIDALGLDKDARRNVLVWGDSCADIASIGESSGYHYDEDAQTILLNIPQSYLAFNDPNWIPPAQRDQGIDGAFLDYDLNYSRNMPKQGNDADYFSSYGTLGANLGAWRARADFQYSANKTQGQARNSHFDWAQAYVFRDIPNLSAKILAGQSYTASSVFDNVRFQGVSLYTDDNMLPELLKGYAPEITGIAETDAMVIVSQQGRVIHQSQVPAGPFRINDIGQFTFGMLDVRVEETSGKVTEFKIYANSTPFLTRYKQFRYKLNAGEFKPLNNNSIAHRNFATTELSYGLTNTVSLYGGLATVLNNNEYNALNLGLGLNLGLVGAVSLDVTQSRAQMNHQSSMSGKSYRLNYSKNFSSTGTQFNFVGYRFSEKDYMSLTRYIDSLDSGRYVEYSAEKNLFSVMVSQYIPLLDSNLSMSGTHQKFWDSSSSNSYSFYFSKTINQGKFKDLSITFNGTHYNQTSSGSGSYKPTTRNTYSVSFSYPLDKRNQIMLSSYYNDQDKTISPSVDVYGNSDSGNTSYNIGMRADDGIRQPSATASLTQRMPAGTFTLSGGKSETHSQFSTGYSGSLTATQYGIAAHQRVYPRGSRLFIDTGDHAGMVFDRAGLVRSNHFGAAVASNVTNYRFQEFRLNENLTTEDVAADNVVIQTALTDGAIGYHRVDAVSGDQAILKVMLSGQKVPPFGATIFSEEYKREVGMIADNGIAYIVGLKPNAILKVQWVDRSCTIKLHEQQYNLNSITEVLCN